MSRDVFLLCFGDLIYAFFAIGDLIYVFSIFPKLCHDTRSIAQKTAERIQRAGDCLSLKHCHASVKDIAVCGVPYR